MFHTKSLESGFMDVYQEVTIACENEVEGKIVNKNADQLIASSDISSMQWQYSPYLDIPLNNGGENRNDISYSSNETRENNYTSNGFYTNNFGKKNTHINCLRQHFCANKSCRVKNKISKRKRKRTMFTTEQIIALEEVFHRKPYINRQDRIALSNKLQISEKSTKVWFQNRRRLADKSGYNYTSDSPSSEETSISDNISDRLTIIETEINENTDRYGYVTLNDKTMTELVTVIDEYLSQDLNPEEEIIEPVQTACKVIYEPISPVSLPENYSEIEQRTELFIHGAEQCDNIKSILFF